MLNYRRWVWVLDRGTLSKMVGVLIVTENQKGASVE